MRRDDSTRVTRIAGRRAGDPRWTRVPPPAPDQDGLRLHRLDHLRPLRLRHGGRDQAAKVRVLPLHRLQGECPEPCTRISWTAGSPTAILTARPRRCVRHRRPSCASWRPTRPPTAATLRKGSTTGTGAPCGRPVRESAASGETQTPELSYSRTALGKAANSPQNIDN